MIVDDDSDILKVADMVWKIKTEDKGIITVYIRL